VVLLGLIEVLPVGVQSEAMEMPATVLAGLPPWTWTRLLSVWTLNPGVLVVNTGGGGRAGDLLHVGRASAASAGAGVASGPIVVVHDRCGVGPVGDPERGRGLCRHPVWDRALQNIVLLMITPMRLALGAPLSLLREVLPARARSRADWVLHTPVARALSFPVVVTAALIAPLFVVYLTPLYEASLRSCGCRIGHPRHAAWEYSCISPPSRSRRRTRSWDGEAGGGSGWRALSTCWGCPAVQAWLDRLGRSLGRCQAAVVVPVIWFQVVNRAAISRRYSAVLRR
jgi:Cytochrome c oxidase caa3 assembly factor (Caa3_CtaG)